MTAYLRAIIFMLTFLTIGCGDAALQAAKKTVITVGQAWMEVDSDFSVAYEKARIEARETSSTWEERDAKLEKWEAARKAVVASGLAVKTAALAVSVAEDGYLSDWSAQVKKVIEAARAMYQALQIIGVKVPESIATLVK